MYDTNQIEKEILEFWDKNKIFDKLREKNKDKKKWKFIDGPITANNPMGVHHAWGRTYKDLFHRFKAMQGHEMRYQNGFDCQGLWVEREEEKALGLKDKKDIEAFGILKFVQACKKRVEKFSKVQTEQSIRLGYWMDWDNSYYTMTDANNLHNWYLLKKYYENGWLYKGKDAVPWCWRCGTASSKHDIVTEGYKEVTHTALFMRFPVKGKENEYFLIFTTTPWTVPANVAIAVNEELAYVKVKQGSKSYWLADSRTEELSNEEEQEILEKKKGKELAGMEYEMPYQDLEPQKDAPHKVVLWALASGEEGTGIVHIAPGCGAEDFELGKEMDFPAISPLGEDGIFQDGFGEFSGKKYSEVTKEVLEDMEEKGFIYKTEPYTHRYPHCWRCSEELVFRLVDEWYVKGDEIRQKLLDENEKITWYPEYGKVRQKDWFNNMGDWLISRKRYWGLPLPIWECECGNIDVMGSLEELKEHAIDPKKVDDLPEVHRPWVDEIKIKCTKCGKEVERILDVGDAWLDAGIVPLSTIGPYLENKEYWKEWFPADLISENMPGQYRGWFNALFWASTALVGQAPFKALFGYETLKDEKGEEMHKSKGNAIWFDDAVEKIGADPMRLLYALQDPALELKFGYNVVKEPKNTINILYNMSRLVKNTELIESDLVEDRWIISKFNSLVMKVTEELENLHPHIATRALQYFWLNDLSRGYIQMVRDRLSLDDQVANGILKEIYLGVVKLCAPIMPFITEKIWQDLKEKLNLEEESIHLCEWPKADEKLIDVMLEEEMEAAQQIIQTVLSRREDAKMGIRWPLASATVKTDKEIKDTAEVIKKIANLKDIKFEKGEQIEAALELDLTPELEAEGFSRELTRKIQDLRKKSGLQKEQRIELNINTDLDLSNFEKEMSEKVGADKLTFNEKGKYEFSSKETIKEKDFEIGFNVK